MVPERGPESVTERSESESPTAECCEKQRLIQKHRSEFEHEKDVERIIDSEITSYSLFQLQREIWQPSAVLESSRKTLSTSPHTH